MSIIAIVDSSENIDLFTSRPIRLSFILDMSKVIVDSLIHAYYLKNKKKINYISLNIKRYIVNFTHQLISLLNHPYLNLISQMFLALYLFLQLRILQHHQQL